MKKGGGGGGSIYVLKSHSINVLFSENIPKIAFSANTVTDHVNLGLHHTLVFGNAISNVGNCYHHSTGNFIPNVSGVYVFDVQIVLCSPGHELRTELVLEGKVMAAHYTGDSTRRNGNLPR